jgi:hypothetical protein
LAPGTLSCVGPSPLGATADFRNVRALQRTPSICVKDAAHESDTFAMFGDMTHPYLRGRRDGGLQRCVAPPPKVSRAGSIEKETIREYHLLAYPCR